MRNKSRFFLGLFGLFLLAACNSNVVFESTIIMDNAVWNKSDIAVFPFTPRDTTTKYDVIVSIQNNSNYTYSNLYVFSEIRFPNQQFTRDTIEFFLADAAGEWTGKRRFSKHTNTFNFKQGIQFPYNGEYIFSLEQAMRCINKDCTLSGIEKITFTIVER
ncbi:MAG: gliding motility lipoprotein GldH [Bacteroidetes bacterium]|nr:gliding motility lipoprotein GldH [Bacteroidota bacterium]